MRANLAFDPRLHLVFSFSLGIAYVRLKSAGRGNAKKREAQKQNESLFSLFDNYYVSLFLFEMLYSFIYVWFDVNGLTVVGSISDTVLRKFGVLKTPLDIYL